MSYPRAGKRIDMDLRKWLEESNNDQHILAMRIRAQVAPILESPFEDYENHSIYTDHSIRHSDRIIEIMGRLSEVLMSSSSRFSPIEVFVLLASAFLHDVGLQDRRQDVDSESIRKHHQELSKQIIYESIEQRGRTGIPLDMGSMPGILDMIALVAAAHRAVDIEGDQQYRDFTFGNSEIRLPLLAALLRFGDELDIDWRRAPREKLQLKNISAPSRFHWYKCYYVSGVRIANECITVSFQFPEGHTEYEALIGRHVDGKISGELDILRAIFEHYGIRPILNPPERVYRRGIEPMPTDVAEYARTQAVQSLERQKQEIDRIIETISFPAEPSKFPAKDEVETSSD